MRIVVSYSGGLGSFAAALLLKRQGHDVRLLFCDTKTEDEDLYRFVRDSQAALDIPIDIIADGRDIWQVFSDVRFMGNSRIDPCSKHLKRDLARKHMETHYPPEHWAMGVGIGHDEKHRLKRIEFGWSPYRIVAPLCDTPMTREQILDELDALGIEPPRLYDMGFPHNNCGGFCVKTGQKQMKQLLEKMPQRYAYHEQEQEKLFALLGKRHGFIRKVVDGEMKYWGLKEFREHVEAGGKCELMEQRGCACMV